MLERLRSGDFMPHLGKTCQLVCGEVVIETVLDSVEEYPLARHPYASEDSRVPFMLHLSASPDCPYSDGIFTLKIAGMNEIRGVYLNRILNITAVPASVFQVIFN